MNNKNTKGCTLTTIYTIPTKANIIEILENQDDIDDKSMQDILHELVGKSTYFDVPTDSKDVFEVLRSNYDIKDINKEFNNLLNNGDFELLKNTVLQELIVHKLENELSTVLSFLDNRGGQ